MEKYEIALLIVGCFLVAGVFGWVTFAISLLALFVGLVYGVALGAENRSYVWGMAQDMREKLNRNKIVEQVKVSQKKIHNFDSTPEGKDKEHAYSE